MRLEYAKQIAFLEHQLTTCAQSPNDAVLYEWARAAAAGGDPFEFHKFLSEQDSRSQARCRQIYEGYKTDSKSKGQTVVNKASSEFTLAASAPPAPPPPSRDDIIKKNSCENLLYKQVV